MTQKIDSIDTKILGFLQRDATLSVDEISDRAGLSRNACWRRIKVMEQAGIIAARVALLDAVKIGCPLHVLVMIRTHSHDANWLDTFHRTVRAMPEVVSAYRMTGDLDYVLRVRVADVPAYDAFYKRLTSRISLSDVSASFVMEEIKETTALPL
ncbi:MAG: transcriptional regulator [Thalassobium sp.]|mgnify:FL=1|nr:MAG: transcriptional regulator [Thalassobium sp.]